MSKKKSRAWQRMNQTFVRSATQVMTRNVDFINRLSPSEIDRMSESVRKSIAKLTRQWESQMLKPKPNKVKLDYLDNEINRKIAILYLLHKERQVRNHKADNSPMIRRNESFKDSKESEEYGKHIKSANFNVFDNRYRKHLASTIV